ncbi:MAG: heparinase II/III family protein, partial [Kiritimatiellota bacterium]|nr:heparinase II/III family protein [Kiritimatiellota bacterium]
RYTFMVDGMFPESASYIHDMGDGVYGALREADGFSDPRDFTAAVDGRHIENFQMEGEAKTNINMRLVGRMATVRDRLYFPDGALLTVHDSWSQTQGPRDGVVREHVEPYLLPEFSHAILGQGTKPDWMESHLHYSGCYGHRHFDMLTFTLWAYGDELTADIGYSHIGGYETTTLSHNLVVVDERMQLHENIHRGDLLAWYPNSDACQVAQAADTNVYPQTQRYRRAIINVPFALGKAAVVDIFETRGGRRQEWMANGCADYEQTVETTLTDPVKKLPNLAPDGQALLINMTNYPHNAGVPDELYLPRTKISPYYGAFTDALVYRNEKPWSLTMKPCPPVPAGTPGAGPRAVVTNEVRPGLRLHWLAPLDGEAIVCKAPRQRYFRETQNEDEAWRAWNRNLMPKVIVRRDAKAETPSARGETSPARGEAQLDSTFVAAWEPFREAPWIEQVSKLQVEESAGVGVRLAGSGCEAVVLYRK